MAGAGPAPPCEGASAAGQSARPSANRRRTCGASELQVGPKSLLRKEILLRKASFSVLSLRDLCSALSGFLGQRRLLAFENRDTGDEAQHYSLARIGFARPEPGTASSGRSGMWAPDVRCS